MAAKPIKSLELHYTMIQFLIKSNSRTFVEYSTGRVEDAAEVAFNSDLSDLIDLDVELLMRLIAELDSAHVKFDV